MLAAPSGNAKIRCVKSQYSSRLSPLRAKTGVPPSAMAAAAWSWVEKMLQEAQRTSAPSALRVSMSTAVWMVMWREPAMRAPLRGLAAAYSSRMAMRPGISVSAMAISRRPQGARVRSATWKSVAVVVMVAPLASAGVRLRALPTNPAEVVR